MQSAGEPEQICLLPIIASLTCWQRDQAEAKHQSLWSLFLPFCPSGCYVMAPFWNSISLYLYAYVFKQNTILI